jgi:GT2 family glycosyltransferase
MISIIICSIDPDRFRAVCEMYGRVFAGESFEIVAIHDAQGLAEGYNRAVTAAKGDLVIFSHDDVEVLNADFKHRLIDHMAHADLVGVAGATRVIGGAWASNAPPYVFGQIAHQREKGFEVILWGVPKRRIDGIKVMDGVFLCARRPVVEKVKFDETTFAGFHLYDVDFTFRAFLAGFRLAVGCDLRLLHFSSGRWDRSWRHDENVFRAKFHGRLETLDCNSHRIAGVDVETREELLEVMSPHWWDR